MYVNQISSTNYAEISIEFPIDMLWQDVDSNDYMADDTETAYAASVRRALHRAGYNATVTWSNVVATTIEDGNGAITDDRYNEIRNIIDSVSIEYIEIEAE